MINKILTVCKQMLYKEPFYGSVLVTLQKEISENIPTACVGLNGIAFKLLVNPEFWKTLNNDQQLGLIKHEIGHIINFHLTEYSHLKDPEIANIAMDIQINQTIPKEQLPPGACMWDGFKDLKPNMDTNWYYKQLSKNYKDKSCQATVDAVDAMKNGEKSSTDGKGNSITLPQHQWEEIHKSSDTLKKIISNTVQVQLEEIIKNTDAGKVPGGLTELLSKLKHIEPPKFNWKAYVRNFATTSTRVDVRKTNRKKSKRFIDMRGSREKFYSHILLALDTSASFSTKELIEAQNEMHHLNKLGHDITVVQFDTEITKQFKFNPREEIAIIGRGGTSFQPICDLFKQNRNKYSCLIIFTDGEASTPKDVKGNILWVHSTVSNINQELPGHKIKLN